MKSLNTVAACLMLLASACRKSGDTIRTAYFRADIDGKTVRFNETTTLAFNGRLQVSGADDQGTSIRLELPAYTGPGIYYLGAAYTNTADYSSGSLRYPAQDGLIRITKDNATEIQGNFYFETDPSGGGHRVENGTFYSGK